MENKQQTGLKILKVIIMGGGYIWFRFTFFIIDTMRAESNMSRYTCIVQKVEAESTISLEMPVPSQGHCGFPSFPVVD
jgi:hypothetical protein